MLVIRLSRTGKAKQPNFRVVVQDRTSSPKKDFVDLVGAYNPTSPNKDLMVDEERIKHWISQGAIPSDTVATLLKKKGMTGMEKYMTARDKQRKPTGAEKK